MFNTIDIDRNKLTIMGVKFSDLKTLESTANAIGSNMFEGFKPTEKGIDRRIPRFMSSHMGELIGPCYITGCQDVR